ncbi:MULTISPECIES: D-alanine--D-alanine ligase [unclassified Streptomyces]|uniref:D-alanine--D-alanine ligase family protein n=1 Tax=unclassified Streptomyces TaxID=2593676 RepID=UPI0035D78048
MTSPDQLLTAPVPSDADGNENPNHPDRTQETSVPMNPIDPTRYGQVAVVTGGWSQERDRSLASSKAVLEALAELGIRTKTIDLEVDRETLATDLGGSDVAMLAIAGQGAEDGALQGLLETLGIPYTGSGVLASALGMNKVAAKKIISWTGVHTARDYQIAPNAPVDQVAGQIETEIGYPLIIKPLSEGGSIGLALVRERGELTAALTAGAATDLMAEQYVDGRSVSVGVLEGEEGPVALSPLETEAPGGLYDYEAKRIPGQALYHCPARLPDTVLQSLRRAAVTAHKALGCSGYSRHDFVMQDDVKPFWLEVNTLPGLTRVGNLARMADADGISYTQLIAHILSTASVRRQVSLVGIGA